jgi:hypothetical protein
VENIALGFVLFCVYFCAVSCFLFSGKGGSVATKINPEPIEKQVREMFRTIDAIESTDCNQDSIATETESEVIETQTSQAIDENVLDEINEEEPTHESVIKEETDQDLIEALKLDKLTLRKARPVARVVNVGQNISVKKLRERIRQRLEEKPELIPAVYKVLEVPFPNVVHRDTYSA